MIFFDVTKTGSAGHRSGLTRVSTRLREELGAAATSVTWDHGWRSTPQRKAVTPCANDWLFTAELFSEPERPGFSAFVEGRTCRTAALFHDAIPLQHPHITWPQSVARHPGYMKLLARFDHVCAVSAASRDDLLGFWRWQGVERPPSVGVIELGADFAGQPRAASLPQHSALNSQPASLLCVGIIEPRKNQVFLLEVCQDLWREGLEFDLHLVGRVNRHFGPPIVARIKALQKIFPRHLHFHAAADDATLARLHAGATAVALPTIAEGCGLPLLEALWLGVPCVASDLPSLRENAADGGCVLVPVNAREAWRVALRRVLAEPAHRQELAAAGRQRALPTWSAASHALAAALR